MTEPTDTHCQLCGTDANRLNDLHGCCARYSGKLIAIDRFIREYVQEVKNAAGGVVGYRLDLNCDETRTLWNMTQLMP